MTEQLTEEFDAEDFLEVVYGSREGWIDLPARVGNYWVPFYTSWPNEGAVTRRIDSSLRDREDLYYSVAQFAERGRAIQHVLPSRWLWADLDEVHPTEGARLGLQPTIAIESSPGRYQALWRLTKELNPRDLERVNRGLSYALGADRGGWDLTQVLRIPGTRNWKYPGGPAVRLMWHNDSLVYKASYVWDKVREFVPTGELRSVIGGGLEKKPITARAKALLRTKPDEVVEGERSARLWELECLLAEAGLGEDDIYDLVSVSVWHKWRGQSSGAARLAADIRKAITKVRREKYADKTKERDLDRGRPQDADSGSGDGSSPESADHGGDRLPFIGFSSFMAMVVEEPKWMIRNWWVAGSQGIIGGEPKTQKTTLAMAMAMAVASGKDFLNEFTVGDPGPVLMVQEENAPWLIQDRLRKLGHWMGVVTSRGVRTREAGRGALGRSSMEVEFGEDLPLRILNNFGFDLAIEEHRDMLEAEVESLRPKLLILDPLYLILGTANENTGAELRPFLKWLLGLRYEYNCAVQVIHHMRKQQQNGPVVRAGQRLMGNAILHGWVDSAVYTALVDETARLTPGDPWLHTKAETEFRSMPPQRPFELYSRIGLPGALGIEVRCEEFDLTALIRNIVREAGTDGITAIELGKQLGLDRRTILSRVRGAPAELGFVIREGARGRGKSHRLFLDSELNGHE